MEAEEIVKNLRATPYKFTYANKVRSEAKKMDDYDFRLLKVDLRRHMARSENAGISKAIQQIIN